MVNKSGVLHAMGSKSIGFTSSTCLGVCGLDKYLAVILWFKKLMEIFKLLDFRVGSVFGKCILSEGLAKELPKA